MKEIIDKLDFIKIISFCSVENTVKGMRRPVIDWEKIYAKDTSNKDVSLSSEIYKGNKQPN